MKLSAKYDHPRQPLHPYHNQYRNFISFKESKDGKSFYFLDPDGYKLELHVGTWQERLKEKQLDPWPNTQFFYLA